MDPSIIVLGADNDVEHLKWTTWNATDASGVGEQEEDNCKPDCAGGSVKWVRAAVSLGDPESGVFTALSEKTGNATTNMHWSVGEQAWAIGLLLTKSGIGPAKLYQPIALVRTELDPILGQPHQASWTACQGEPPMSILEYGDLSLGFPGGTNELATIGFNEGGWSGGAVTGMGAYFRRSSSSEPKVPSGLVSAGLDFKPQVVGPGEDTLGDSGSLLEADFPKSTEQQAVPGGGGPEFYIEDGVWFEMSEGSAGAQAVTELSVPLVGNC